MATDHQITAANRQFFNSRRLESDLQQKVADLIVKSITDNYIFDEEDTVVLDFACGIGKAGHIVALWPSFTPIYDIISSSPKA